MNGTVDPMQPPSITLRPGTRTLALILCAGLSVAILAAPIVAPHLAEAGDEPFTYPSNSGLTGLLETPTARVLGENRYRVGATHAKPYFTYYGTVGLSKRLEVNGRITEISGIQAFQTGYGDYKDKAADIKFRFLPEGKYAPALALAIMDPHGTRIFPTQAIVASKQIYPFDFTVGFGNGRLGKNPLPAKGEGFAVELFESPKEWLKDGQVFGGIQFAPSDRFAVVAEYSPIRYERQTGDPGRDKYFTSPVPSRINAGIRWKPTRWSEIDASWQRGEQLAVAASVAFDIGKPIVPIYDPPYREPQERRQDPGYARIAAALRDQGFSDIGVGIDGLTLRIEAQNDRYYFTPRAMQAVIDVLPGRIPGNAEYVSILLKENGIPTAEFVTTAHGIEALHEGEISQARFFGISAFRTDESAPRIRETAYRRLFTYGVKPSLETFLNDPSGFFKYRLGLAGWLTAHPWRGGSAIAGVEGYPLNNVSTSVGPLSIPVRSDIAEYKKENAALGRLMFEQFAKVPGPCYGRVSAGLLEVQYAGADGEIAVPLLRGRVLAGLGGSMVRKREPGDPFGLKGDGTFHTAFLNTRLNVPELDFHFDVKAGRFLAGDRGARFTISKFINGVVLSAWYGVTDTRIFSDPFNRGYSDKGISVDIPLRLFTGHDSRTAYRYALSPWTRDVAQDIDHFRTLFDFIGRNTDVALDSDKETMYMKKK